MPPRSPKLRRKLAHAKRPRRARRGILRVSIQCYDPRNGTICGTAFAYIPVADVAIGEGAGLCVTSTMISATYTERKGRS